MKNDKFSRKWKLGAVATMLASLSLGVVAGCGDNSGDSSPVAPPAEGLGVFYFDAGNDEYQLSLADGNKVTFIANGESKTGTYTTAGSVVTFKFDGESGETSATIDGDVLSWTYNNEQMRFFKKVFYTVSYDEVGGEDIADVKVVNGKTVSKPDDPVREGYQFLGWYADSEYQTPFMFDTQIVISDITLYAKWALVAPGAVPFTVDFDLGYEVDEDEAYAPMETIGGKIYDVPTPTRAGYKFCGWWISMYENGEKLSYQYTADTEFKANTTLFAVWESESTGSKLSAPYTNVSDSKISWEGVEGVNIYRLKVSVWETNSEGKDVKRTIIDTDVSATSYEKTDWVNAPAGDYDIEVTAVAANEANNSDVVSRSFIKNAVGRVSQFSVIDGRILLFNRVENAEVYYVTVYCGSDAHEHVMYNNGDSTYYSFANCDMAADGIKFTVTAAANGFASVKSETYVFNRSLDKVEGITVDEETQIVSWAPVKDATNYIVSVSCGDKAHVHEFVNVGSKTYFSLKECSAVVDGDIIINVYAQTKGFNSPEPTEYSYNKTKLATPSNIVFGSANGEYILSWNAVEAEGDVTYQVKINGRIFDGITNTSVDVMSLMDDWVPNSDYTISVKAVTANNDSAWSDVMKVKYKDKEVDIKISYKQSTISWTPVIGAAEYEYNVNGGPVTVVSDGSTSAMIELTQEGTNVVGVRAIDKDSQYFSNWVYYEIKNAVPVIFDGKGAKEDIPTQYKVAGDYITLPEPTRAGYDFAGWYNTPNGPESNGKKFESGIYSETSETVLYAYWTNAAIEIEYAGVNGDFAGKLDKESGFAIYKQDFQLDVPTVDDGTQVFLGWFIGDEQITDDRGYSLKPWNFNEVKTVTAKYVTDVLQFVWMEGEECWSVRGGLNIKKVSTVTIPAMYEGTPVRIVGSSAFHNCTRLVVLNIPDTITNVAADTAFTGCMRLKEVNVYDYVNKEGEDIATQNPTYFSDEGVLMHRNETTGYTDLVYYPEVKEGSYVISDKVTSIPLGAFARAKKVTEITIPTSVKVIESYAFRDCVTLEKIIFAEGGTDALTIGEGAFQNCVGLKNITLPARLTELAVNEETHTITLFNGCTSLTHVNVERGSVAYSSNDGIITDKEGSTIIYCPTARKGSYTVPEDIEAISDYAFASCKYLTEVVIPGTVSTIGAHAFDGCTKIVRVTFADGAVGAMKTEIGEYAFANMTSLKKVAFESGSAVSTIGAYAFSGAVSLTELTIPTTMTSIGDYAFEKAESLSSVAFAEGEAENLSFGKYVFSDCTALTSVYLPKSVTELNLGVFDGCVNIAEVKVSADNEYYKDEDGVVFTKDGTELMFFPKGKTGDENGKYAIPAGVEKISEGAFKGMYYVKEIVVSNTVTDIGNYAFKDSIALATLTFEGGNDTALLTIGDEAFAGCAAISSVTLPDRTKSIGAKAFYKVSMTSINAPASLESIGDYAFAETAITSAEISANAVLGEYVFEGCKNLATATFATGYEGTVIPAGTFKNTAISSITIPGSIEAIGDGAFYGCKNLATVTFDEGTAPLVIGNEFTYVNGVKAEAEGVFTNCTSLTSVVIPDRTTVIGTYAFTGCTKLATVTVSEKSTLSRIGDSAFYSCTALSKFYVPKTVQNTVYNDDGVAQEYAIGKMAFANTALVDITFEMGGEGDLSFGTYAFTNCGGIVGEEFNKETGTMVPIYQYMSKISLPNRVAPIYTFENGNGSNVLVKVDGITESTFGQTTLASITIEDGGMYYGTKDNVLYKKTERGGEYVFHELMFIPGNLAGEITVPYTVSIMGRGSRSLVQKTPGSITAIKFEATPEGEEPVDLKFGSSAFSSMTTLKNFEFPERLVEIGERAFSGCSGLTSVSLPASLKVLGKSAFSGNTGLTSITFAKGIQITEIPYGAFEGCSNTKLTTLEIPALVETIGSKAFYNCKISNLSYAGTAVESIGDQAFYGFKITRLELPEGLTKLEGTVFQSMSSLTTIVLPTTLSTLTHEVSSQAKFVFDGLSNLTTIEVKEGSPYFSAKDGVLYSADGKELVYHPIKNGGTTRYKYIIPEGVETIGEYAFYKNTYLNGVVLTPSVTSIGKNAFYGCSYITSVDFARSGDTTLSIGDGAFQSCARLNGKTVDGRNVFTIPETVMVDGDNAFNGCFRTSVSNLYIVFEGNNDTKALNNTFYNCTGVVGVENIPSNLTVMMKTFYSCSNLKTVTFKGQGRIDQIAGAFYGCKALTSIELPNVGSMTSGIQMSSSTWKPTTTVQGAFEGCTALKTVTMLSANMFGYSTFKGCTALQSVTIPEGVTTINSGSFYGCTALKSVKLPDSLSTIDTYLFGNCSALTSITIPDYISTIHTSAFEGCTGLTSVKLGEGVTTIGERAFYGASKVTAIEFPSALDTIGAYAFYGWKSLAAMEIPASVKTIETYAFGGCSGLQNIVIADGIETLGDYAFAGCSSVETFNLPATVINLGIGVFDGWESLKNLTTNGSQDFAFKNGVLYNSNYTKILYVSPATAGEFIVENTITSLAEGLFAGTKITSVVLPDTIREIPARAFYNCALLETVKMPATLTRIGNMAFQGCTSLKEIFIPKTVHSVFEKEYFSHVEGSGYYVTEAYDGIGHAAFYGCTSLENVVFEEGGTQRLSFGDFAFYNCTSLKGTLNEETKQYTFVIPTRVRGVAIPNAVYVHPDHIGSGQGHARTEQGVGMYAFANCTALTNVVFEEETNIKMTETLILSIGAFQNCYNLQTVTFAKSLSNISISVPGGKGEMMTAITAAIAENVFMNCSSLTKVTFPDDTSNIYAAQSAFEGLRVDTGSIMIVTGATGVDYGGGKADWQDATSRMFTIDGCGSCSKSCKFYDPHNGIFLPEDPWSVEG